MKILFTCGGTAGHINPALAVAGLIRERHPDAKILFVGADGGMETKLVPREGYPIRTVSITNFQRKLNASGVRHNLKTLLNLRTSGDQAKQILDEFQPDAVIGTGGYASYPVVRQAAARGIPTAIHESNATPGLTTKTLAKYADRVMVGFEESREYYPKPDRVVVTGTPVRGDFFRKTHEEARRSLGLDERPLVLSYWGSLGAREMNKKIAEFIRLECITEPFNHIHATGKEGYEWMPGYLEELGVHLSRHLCVELREYIYDMATVMQAADLVICRGGASTISEITALQKPSIIVPSPNVTDNHQEKNARVLEARGAAKVLLESECDGRALFETAQEILADGAKREEMKSQLAKLAIPDSSERIYRTILEILR
ncbi:UDP-N-acetylglucosamine--N-acetylmuramyl-(pentapeptide) pyrophosphoryl-undecaprenol N-acetylglucosamine transferase [Papillibacter cinnamivorans]|uniref:UDP-N-acetylglucosamine--N-acetylmuramyl-(pentapeptide) pyrophosphoryl-undecaprenol N-acetylglucosamine transferase n=1 Tax=Papillibacter cinnamivorans DSM 12816 TaxID=1122930 RepID=A0A1W1Z091_9FIRM|nr:UDP-N-acetylglucosamine--N-acetylmuramyl-(pentapeptide) pyrophosphoryl-undecaprenol N-acetylglucosamine transferase [Papillibacter cinnamivorans]SMC41501.1 UDP-N-acetylglucosamine-N-acetylmuramylpentapeptide N-acetylglucosamine transferase [Papillibacter cinnamivorans DSM 12816]